MVLNERINMYDDTRYEYRSMEIPCPLCECMISRFRMAQHQLSKKLKAIQDIEKNQLHIVELMVHMNTWISTSHTFYNQQTCVLLEKQPLKS